MKILCLARDSLLTITDFNKSFIFGVLLLFFSSTQSLAATLVVDGNGQLLGARQIHVEGSLYDVSFEEGTCVEVFDGCSFTGYPPFGSNITAAAAVQALLDQVFLDSLGNFDSEPNLTFGCEDLTRCFVYTPSSALGTGVFYYYTTNGAVTDSTFTGSAITPKSLFDSSTRSDRVWAVWTVSAVPLPATAWLFLSAVGGLLAVRGAGK